MRVIPVQRHQNGFVGTERISGSQWMTPAAARFGKEPAGDHFQKSVTPLAMQVRNFRRWAERTGDEIHHSQEGQTERKRFYIPAPVAPVTSASKDWAGAKRLTENADTLKLYERSFGDFFWTGEECSNPYIKADDMAVGKRWDQMKILNLNDHAERLRHIEVLHRLGIHNIRLGIQNHLIADPAWEGITRAIGFAEKYRLPLVLPLLKWAERQKWKPMTDILTDFKNGGIKVSLDLQHFGLPDQYHNEADPAHSDYLNPKWPEHFVRFTQSVLRTQLDKIDALTIINEPMVTNAFSGGLWNEAFPGGDDPRSDHYFIQRAMLMAKAFLMSRFAIEEYIRKQPDPEKARKVLIHNESVENRVGPGAEDQENNRFRRFLTSDLMLGTGWLLKGDPLKTEMGHWLEERYLQAMPKSQASMLRARLETGLAEIQHLHRWFEGAYGKTAKADTVFGVDYYIHNESGKVFGDNHLSDQPLDYPFDVELGIRKGLYGVTRDYWERYHMPVLHTETNRYLHMGPDWGVQQLMELAQLDKAKIPILGFTWYSLMHQRGWEHKLRVDPEKSMLNPIGLADPTQPGYPLTEFSVQTLPGFLKALRQPEPTSP